MDRTDLAVIRPGQHHIPILGVLPKSLHTIGAGDGSVREELEVFRGIPLGQEESELSLTEGTGSRQRGHRPSPPPSGSGQDSDHLLVDEAIASQDLRLGEAEWAPIEAGDTSAGLLNHEGARRHVPGS